MPSRSLLPAPGSPLLSTSEALLLGLGTADVAEAERRLERCGVFGARHTEFTERCWDAAGVLAVRRACRATSTIYNPIPEDLDDERHAEDSETSQEAAPDPSRASPAPAAVAAR